MKKMFKSSLGVLVIVMALVVSTISPVVMAHAEETQTNDESVELLARRKMFATVDDTYKVFTCQTFVGYKYDVTSRVIYFNRGFWYLGAKPIKYQRGWYRGWSGTITTYQCRYKGY